jgi:integrase
MRSSLNWDAGHASSTLSNIDWDLRTKAILAVAYSTMARRSELVALTLEDVKFNSEAGDGIAIIRMTKANREQARYLAPGAVGHRSVRPQEVARIAGMPTFHRLIKGSRWHFFLNRRRAVDVTRS